MRMSTSHENGMQFFVIVFFLNELVINSQQDEKWRRRDIDDMTRNKNKDDANGQKDREGVLIVVSIDSVGCVIREHIMFEFSRY